jgi:hypothetical protein
MDVLRLSLQDVLTINKTENAKNKNENSKTKSHGYNPHRNCT